jgi:hypothetical protein
MCSHRRRSAARRCCSLASCSRSRLPPARRGIPTSADTTGSGPRGRRGPPNVANTARSGVPAGTGAVGGGGVGCSISRLTASKIASPVGQGNGSPHSVQRPSAPTPCRRPACMDESRAREALRSPRANSLE